MKQVLFRFFPLLRIMILNSFVLKNGRVLRVNRPLLANIAFPRTLFLNSNIQRNNKDYNDKGNEKNRSYFKAQAKKYNEYWTSQYTSLLQAIAKQRAKVHELFALVQNASTSINKITGYDSIQALKSGIKSIEIKLYQDRIILEKESAKLKNLTQQQNKSQSLINDLLSRKSTWSPKDLKVFTDAYNQNQQNIEDLSGQTKKSTDLERTVKTMEQDLHNLILKRYHEEQIWSDKIRKLSTYGTLLLLVINLLSFFILHLIFEPRKRKRLVAAFEKETKDYIDEVKCQQVEQMVRLENLINSKMEMLFADKNELLLEKNQRKNSGLSYTIHNFFHAVKLFINGSFLSMESFCLKLFRHSIH